MQAQTLARALAAVAVLVAAGVVLLARGPIDEPLPVAPPDEEAAVAVSDPREPRTGTDAKAPLHEADAVAKVRELEAMSETFRNSTFLIAIRDAGYTCNELLRVYGGIDDSGKWTATCSEMLAYTVGVTGNGTLRVDPFMQYFDGLAPQIVPNETIVPAQPPPRLPPPPR